MSADWSALRQRLGDTKVASVTIPWTELDKLVGGLPESASRHSAYWSGHRSGWKGWRARDVHVGHAVTFVRVGDRGAEPVRRQPIDESLARPDVYLVSCSKSKRSASAAAKDLYVSPTFSKAKAYVERTGAPWFILSAEHGLVDPEDLIEPYDLRLSDTDPSLQRAWGERVVRRLLITFGPVEGKVIEIHAGRAYLEPIEDVLCFLGATIVEPLTGLRQGERLAWYESQPEPSQASAPADPSAATAALRDLAAGIRPSDLVAAGRRSYPTPGLYSWWVDSAGAEQLSAGLGHTIEPGLIYAGLAGADRTVSGRPSSNTLWLRLATMHLGARRNLSTFRKTIGSILTESWEADSFDEAAVTGWMKTT